MSTSLTYTLRGAELSDLSQIQEIYNEAIENTTAVYEYLPFSDQYMREWYDTKIRESWPVLVFEKNDSILAFGTYGSFRNRAAYNTCVEHSLYVRSEARGQGLGKDMLQALINEAQKDGRHTMVGGIDADNHISIELHRQFGFQQVGRLPEVAYKFNRWLDLCFMQLILPPKT
jgi:L-amino acid N-acyltransferase